MSFKQYWKAEESLARIPACAGNERLSLLSQGTGSGPEVGEWQQVRGKAAGGKRAGSVPAMTLDQTKTDGKILAPQNSLIILTAVLVGPQKFPGKVSGQWVNRWLCPVKYI